MKEHIELILRHECSYLELIDIEGTANAIMAYCQFSGLNEVKDWRDSEALALLTLDWLSMHEAVWK